MMEIRLNLYQADRDFQVEIGGGGFGYRLFGPKFDGSSRLIKSVILSERDKEEIVRFVNPDAEAVERKLAMKQDDWLKECQENDRLRAALAAAQGEVEILRGEVRVKCKDCNRLDAFDENVRLREALGEIHHEITWAIQTEIGRQHGCNVSVMDNLHDILKKIQEAIGGKP